MMGIQDDKVVSMFREKEGATSEVNSLNDKYDIIGLLKDIKTILNEQRKLEKEVGTMSEYITKDAFEQFEKRIDDKLNTLPDIMADKMDAKISGLEARQTKWFVGIATTVGIGTLSILIAAIGVIVSLFIK